MSVPDSVGLACSGPPLSKWFGFFPEFRKDVLGFLAKCRGYGDVVRLPIGRLGEILLRRAGIAVYLLHHPDDVKHVLVTNQHNYVKGPVPPVEAKMFGQGLLHLEGVRHHGHRRLLLPFFHGAHLDAYAGVITDKAVELVNGWAFGSTVDVGRTMSRLTLSIIWPLLFGREIGPEADLLSKSLEVGHRLINKQYHSLLARLIPLWVPTAPHREFSRFHRTLDALIRRLIRATRSQGTDRQDVLSLLSIATDEEGRPLTEDAIRDELITLMLAGHETTANALTWTWFLLAQAPDARARMTAEVAQVLQGRIPSVADLPHLVYTKMVWEESLRLYPPAWSLHMRVASTEDRLPSGFLLPAGSYVLLSPWCLQHDPRWFPDPERFDPDRFSPHERKARPMFSYFPFGGGGRRCLGESFAELEGVLVLATLASRVHLRLLEGQRILPEALMTLRPNKPILMTVEPVGCPA